MTTLPRWATYRVNVDGSVTIRFTYCPAVIDAFKRQIPKAFRVYAAHEGKAWTVRQPYVDEAITLLLRHFPDAQRDAAHHSHAGWSERTTPPPATDHFATLHLLPSAPRALVDAAYRTLAKSAHPDRGGSDAAMRRLSEAYDTLSRRLSA